MSRPALHLLVAVLTLAAAQGAAALEIEREQDGVSLHYRDAGDAVPAAVRDRLIATFFKAYPAQRAAFHPGAPARASIVIDGGYDSIAYVGEQDRATTITINPAWLLKHPGDTDLVTHEAMHIVQGYPEYASARVPGWLVEGIADYARDRYGADNAAAGWALPTTIKDGQSFDSGYRVTGAFLKWAETEHPGLVLALDKALRDGRYTPALWRQQTGQAVSALWAQYARTRSDAPPSARRGKR